MPVQFICQNCRRPLSVSRKKIGQTVPCPKCGRPTRVPDEATGATAVALAKAAKQQRRVERLAELIVFDELPPDEVVAETPFDSDLDLPEPPDFALPEGAATAEAANSPPAAPAAPGPAPRPMREPPAAPRAPLAPPAMSSPAPPPPAPAATTSARPKELVRAAPPLAVRPPAAQNSAPNLSSAAAPRALATPPAATPREPAPAVRESAAPVRGEPRSAAATIAAASAEPLVVVPKESIQLFGVLLGAVFCVALGLGFLIGRAVGPVAVPQETAPSDPVVLRGWVQVGPDAETAEPDALAVIVALPVEARPKLRFTARGLSASSPPPRGDSNVVQAIRDLGGAYERAEDDGSFHLIVPRPGSYRLLFLSREVRRAEGDRASEEMLTLLGEYFDSPILLVGNNQYDWSIQTLDHDQPPLVQRFPAE